MPAAGCASRPARWSTASGRAVRPRTPPPGSRRCCATCWPPRPVGCCSGCSPRGGHPPASPPPASTSVAALRGLFAAQGCRLTRPLAARLIGRAQAALPAHPAATAGKAATLAALLGTIDTLDREIAGLEAAMAPCWPAPRAPSSPSSAGWAWSPRPGWWPWWAPWAPPTGGRTGRRCGGRLDWTRPQPVRTYRCPAMHQPRGLGLGPAGDPGPGSSPLPAVCQQPGPWRDRLRARTNQQHKPAKVALAATANAIGRTLFALMASGGDYDPAYPTTRAERKAGGRAA
jgi:hypothetical protein